MIKKYEACLFVSIKLAEFNLDSRLSRSFDS